MTPEEVLEYQRGGHETDRTEENTTQLAKVLQSLGLNTISPPPTEGEAPVSESAVCATDELEAILQVNSHNRFNELSCKVIL